MISMNIQGSCRPREFLELVEEGDHFDDYREMGL